jgi:glycosyltransferase involved in cell wall biosynthesis
MRILFIAKPLSKNGNGVVSALKTEIQGLQKIADVALFNIGVELESDIADKMFYVDDYQTISDLPAPYNKPDLVVFEEVYKLDYFKLYNECVFKKIPYVVIPHGCLVTNAQNDKKLKHMAANILIFNRYIKKAAAVQYLNEQEKNNSKFKCRKAVIIPNSIEYIERQYQTNTDIFKFIYVGRYDVVIKGLDLLIDTFIALKQWCRENKVMLELYGPIEENPNLDALYEKINEEACNDIIKINGPVFDEEKFKKLQEASVFIQTSRNEGQPMGIIEALSFGLPCVVTYATSFGEYCNKNRCGIGVNFSKEELSSAIKEIYNDKEFFEKAKANAMINMKQDFEINIVAKKTLDIYSQLLK